MGRFWLQFAAVAAVVQSATVAEAADPSANFLCRATTSFDISKEATRVLPSRRKLSWASSDSFCQYTCSISSISSTDAAEFCAGFCKCEPSFHDRRKLTSSSLINCLGSAQNEISNALSDRWDLLQSCKTPDCIHSVCSLDSPMEHRKLVGLEGKFALRLKAIADSRDNHQAYYVKVQEDMNSMELQLKLADAAGGAWAVRYLPESTYLFEASLTPSGVELLKGLPGVDYVSEKPAAFKIPDSLLSTFEKTGKFDSVDIRVDRHVRADRQEISDIMNGKLSALLGITNLMEWDSTAQQIRVKGTDSRDYNQILLNEISSLGMVRSIQISPQPFQAFRMEGHYFDEEQAKAANVQEALKKRRLDDGAVQILGMDVAYNRNITGQGVIVGVADTGVYMWHDQVIPNDGADVPFDKIDRNGRKIVQYARYASNGVDETGNKGGCGHGTHVVASIAGNGLRFKNHSGMAYDARVSFMDVGLTTSDNPTAISAPVDAEALLGPHVSAGANIVSFSWGVGQRFYSSFSADIDEYLSQNKEVLLLVAAGNDGDGSSPSSGREVVQNCQGGLVGAPADAKNALTVGASTNTLSTFPSSTCSGQNEANLAFFSSKGPAPDGRRKPDLVCPGFQIESARSLTPAQARNKVETAALCKLAGTSMAAPTCAGFAAVLYQWLRDRLYLASANRTSTPAFRPPAALMRALMIHSTVPLKGVLPDPSTTSGCSQFNNGITPISQGDNRQGFGVVNMKNLLQPTSNSVFFLPNANNNATLSISPVMVHSYRVRGVSGNSPFRVTLAWTDASSITAAGSCRQALVNDLDLSVIEYAEDGATIVGKYIPVGVASGSRDSLNTVEMVEVPANGKSNRNFDVIVNPTSIKVGGMQEYSIVFPNEPISSTTASDSAPSTTASDSSKSGGLSTVAISMISLGAAVLILAAAGYAVRKMIIRRHLAQMAALNEMQMAPAPQSVQAPYMQQSAV